MWAYIADMSFLSSCASMVLGWLVLTWSHWAVMFRMEAMHKQLSGHIHGPIMDAFIVTIPEGSLDKVQMEALACVAEHFNIAYEMKYAREPTAPI